MNAAEFRAMWEKDGFVFREEDRRVKDDAVWVLYGVTCPYGTSVYGRHLGLMLALQHNTGEVLGHNIKNISDGSNWYAQVQEWWERHVEEGLVYVD